MVLEGDDATLRGCGRYLESGDWEFRLMSLRKSDYAE